MSAKPLIRLESARRDERDAVAYYAQEAGLDVALRFAGTLRDAYRSIGDQPGIGSPRYGNLLGIEGLRTARLVAFPSSSSMSRMRIKSSSGASSMRSATFRRR